MVFNKTNVNVLSTEFGCFNLVNVFEISIFASSIDNHKVVIVLHFGDDGVILNTTLFVCDQ